LVFFLVVQYISYIVIFAKILLIAIKIVNKMQDSSLRWLIYST